MDNNTRDKTGASILGFPLYAAGPPLKAQDPRHQQTLLNTVLSNMSQGVLMFDADARLVFSNQRYVEMYGLSPDVVVPGCSLRELLDHRKSVGTFAGDPEDYVAELLDEIATGQTFNTVAKAAGRVFSIVHTAIAGGGWIATHEDVTDRERAEERIVHMARHDALTDLPIA